MSTTAVEDRVSRYVAAYRERSISTVIDVVAYSDNKYRDERGVAPHLTIDDVEALLEVYQRTHALEEELAAARAKADDLEEALDAALDVVAGRTVSTFGRPTLEVC